jgi:hypothetical protein
VIGHQPNGEGAFVRVDRCGWHGLSFRMGDPRMGDPDRGDARV